MILLMETGIGRDATKALYLTPSTQQTCWEMREMTYDHHAMKLDDLDPQSGTFIAAGGLLNLLSMLEHYMGLKALDEMKVLDVRHFIGIMSEFVSQARRTINVKRYFVHDSAPNNAFPVDENDMATFANDPEFANCHEVAGPELPLVHR